jgi:hypothetical protein
MYNFDNVTSLGENSTTVKDMSQYSNNGTISGATWTGNGRRGGAYQFNGTSNYISIPNYTFNIGNTIALRIDFTNISGVQYFLGNSGVIN